MPGKNGKVTIMDPVDDSAAFSPPMSLPEEDELDMPAPKVPPPPLPAENVNQTTLDDVRELIGDGAPFQDVLNAVNSLGGQSAPGSTNQFVAAIAEQGNQSEDEREKFIADATKLRNRMRDDARGLINPKGAFLQYWDFVTTFALIYTLLVTPYEVGLDLPTKADALMVANQIIACIFLGDIVVNFFLPTPIGESLIYERRHAMIAKNYITSGWLFLDVLTIIPWDIMVWQRLLDGKTKSMKLLRILRLVKLVKVLRGSRIIQRWDHSFGIASSTKTLASYGIAMLIVIHLFACGWCLIPVVVGSQRGDVGSSARQALEVAASLRQDFDGDCDACFFNQVDSDGDGYISTSEQAADPTMAALCLSPCLTACERTALASITGWSESFILMSESWQCRSADSGQLTPEFVSKPGEVYCAAMLVSMLQLVGGVSTILPMNFVEYIWFFFVILIGTVLFAVIQGVICGVATNGDPDETEWVQKNDQLNSMMSDIKVPQEQRLFVRSHFRKAKKLFKRQSYDELIDSCLSNELQGDVRFYMCQSLFSEVWYLNQCERSFLEDLSPKLSRECYAPKEPVECEEKLVMITQGMICRAGAFLGYPSSFGDIILTSPMLRDTTEGKALTYSEVAHLRRDDLYEVLEEYPESADKIKQASLKIALQRMTLLIAGIVKSTPKESIEVDNKSFGLSILQTVLCAGEYNDISMVNGQESVARTTSKAAPDLTKVDTKDLLKRIAGESKESQMMTLLQNVLQRQDSMMMSIRNLEDSVTTTGQGKVEKGFIGNPFAA